MKHSSTEISRRALLGAAFAAPVLGAVEGPVVSAVGGGGEGPAPRAATLTTWRRAQATYRRADAALSAVTGTADDALYNRLGARHDRALVRLLTTPAPDAAALADKFDLLIAHQAWELRAGDACLAALQEDAHHLTA